MAVPSKSCVSSSSSWACCHCSNISRCFSDRFFPTKSPGMPGLFSFSSEPFLLQRTEPVVHVFVNLVLGEAVALLQFAFELFAAAFDHVEIVIGEFAPLLLGLALDLLPVTFDLVPIHRHLQC